MKKDETTMEDTLNDQALPIPIQIFLWRQISPFIRPKLGKLHEASCMFCQHAPGHHETKEACKSFEKVLVQNIQFGLSPSLTEAIQSISRWRLIQAALPHVMHASATLLHNRVKDLQNLGAVETKLLYTLHWIILDAAEECAEADYEKGVVHSNPFYYLFSIPTISLFVYLFAPIAQHLKESDFQNFRLENGLKIWQAFWEFRRPDTACFSALCKPRPRAMISSRLGVTKKTSDVFPGSKNTVFIGKSSRDDVVSAESPPSQTVSVSFSDHPTPKSMSVEEEEHISQGWVSSPKDTVFPETIPEESSSTEEEHVVIFRLPSAYNAGLLRDPSVYTADASMLHHQHVTIKEDSTKGTPKTPQVQKLSSSDKDSVESGGKTAHATSTTKGGDVLVATFMDVAVLRCLFVMQWQEEGVYWALHYMYNRLRDISDDVSTQSQPRKRSNSLPIPKIEVSLYQSPESKKRESLKSFMEVPELKDVSPIAEHPLVKAPEESSITRRASEKIKRKMKMADLKAFVETKLMSKSEKALEKIGQDDHHHHHHSKVVPYEQLEYHRSLDTGDSDRPGSALGKSFAPLSPLPVAKHSMMMATNLVKGKSMPSLSCLIDELAAGGYIGEICSERRKPLELQYTHPPATQNPIITVTEHTPIPSPDYIKTRQGSLESQMDSVSMQGSHITPERKPSLTRSQTDSNITYVMDDVQEAPGSLCYITKEGDIDFLVVLKAVHFAALRDNLCWTIRVIEVMLNLVEVLLDVGVLKTGKCPAKAHPDSPSKDCNMCSVDSNKDKGDILMGHSHESPTGEKQDTRKDTSSKQDSNMCPHFLVLNIIMRVIQQLGCSQGCSGGARGPPAECLRVQARCLLGRVRRAAPHPIARLLRTTAAKTPIQKLMPFLHAYLAFCVDPSTLLSPLNQKRGNIKSPEASHGGYATNFGAGLGSAGGPSMEGHLLECMFKVLVTRLVTEIKDLKIQEDIVLYRDIRHLMTYVKEAHGGVFRVVALSGLLDSAERPNKPENTQTTRVIRHIHHSDFEERESDVGGDAAFVIEDRSNRKFLFKKRSGSSTCASLLETEGGDDNSKSSQSPLGNLRKKHHPHHPHALTPRQSERTLTAMGESTTSNKSTTSKSKKFGGIVKWFRKPYGSSSSSYGDSDSPPGEAPPHLMRQASMMPLGGAGRGGSSRGGGSRAGRTLRSARRRVEDRLGRLGLRKMGKKRDGSMEENQGNYMSRRNSFDMGDSTRESEVVVLKERKLVPLEPVYNGMLRFSFLIDICQPGSIPDPHLMAALLDLPHTPVVSRACILLECAHLVHSCNKGQWPQWMKADLPNIRPSVPVPGRVSSHPGIRRLRAAGKMFYQWGEAIAGRLEEMMHEDKQHMSQVAAMMLDPDKQKELLLQDEEEDFLDEASLHLASGPIGAECPMALRLVACVLLLEITAFLRETYQNLPKASCRASVKERPAPWERIYREANRRWSMALSSMGHSQASAQSLQSITGQDADRKISFVLHEPENESEGSSNATLEDGTLIEEKKPARARVVPAGGRPFLLRRGTQQGSGGTPPHMGGGGSQHIAPLLQSHPPPPQPHPPPHPHTGGSFKRKSLKLRRNTKDGKDMEEHTSQARRKVSSLSDRSDTSEAAILAGVGVVGHEGGSGGEESPGVLSDDHDHPLESPDSNDTDEVQKGMPWVKVMVQMMNSFNYYCSHQNFCHPFCYKRNMRASSRLIKSVRKIYGEKFGVLGETASFDVDIDKQQLKKERRGRKVSDQTSSQTSPIRRKDSSASKKDRLDRSVIDGGNRGDTYSVGRAGQKPTVPCPILNYIKTQVRNAFHSPLATLVKGAMLMTEDSYAGVLFSSWTLLLDPSQEVAASAASMFIIAAVKVPQLASEFMLKDLQHSDPNVRINAILRFQVMWKLRYQVWPRMEEGASLTFKVPPPGIEFTLPSPKIGIESLPIVDPPWSPHVKTKDMDVTLNQERHRSLVTATKTRKKQQTEAIRRALQQREDKRKAEREGFLLTTIPITRQAAWEPSIDHPQDDHVEDEEVGEGLRNPAHHTQTANSLFPSCLCSAVVHIIGLLDDAAVNQDGNAVYEVAYQVIWCCLVEDSALFLRYVLEKLTRERQEQMFQLLRHLIRFVPRLPQQAAFALYNYIIGYIMFYVRSPHEDGQMLIGTALSVLWMVVHSVHGIMFKDLKQILRKEQCDASILLTANVPSAKKIIVHGPQERDEGGIPSQFPVQEDTQFCQILRESLDFFGIDEPQQKEYFLIDYKTHQIHNPLRFVRDVYFFKRSQYPQLQLVHMSPNAARTALQRHELLHKFLEIGKVHLTWAILKNVDMVVQRVVFLHEELMKLPSFPRKALECDLDLYDGGELGDQLLGLDVLHKFMWVRLIARMFEAMAGNFAYSGDIHLFLNVLNGALILHSEDSCILRYVTATYINAAFNFKNIFSTNGYLLIMPTLLQIYSNHQTNKLVTTTIEYAVKQFYMMNRKPFILQMFGSVSAILDTDEEGVFGDAHRVQSSCLFNLLLSLETPSPDPLNIAELVKEEKPLKAIDFCYHDENEMVTVLDCINLCVMVVSYSAESVRGYQMLIILEAILPCYVKQIQSPSYNREGKTEKEIIQHLAVAIKTLVNNCEGLSKSYNGPYRSSPEHKGSSQRNFSRGPYSPGFDFEDESHSKYVSDHSRAHPPVDTINEDSELVRAEYRRPRDVLLSLVGEFIGRCIVRLQELAKKFPQDSKPLELLDTRSHVRLADIAHSLLKVSPYDPESMACRGLQRYMSFILPSTEWSNDAMRPALITILRRLDKLFMKISKKPSIRRNTDWDAASGLLKGVYETMLKCPYIMHWQHVKTLLNTCQSLIVSDSGSLEGCSSATAALMAQPPPPHFCSTTVRLIALQILNTGESYSLEHICGGSSVFPTQEKAENILMNLFMPLCLRVGSGRKDVPRMRQSDISFALTAVLQAMSPGMAIAPSTLGGDIRAPSLTFSGRENKRAVRIPVSLYRVAFLALKIMVICFESELVPEWGRIARAMRELGKRNEAAPVLWNFLEFVVTHRSPLFILLLPFIIHKLSQPPIGDHERHMQFVIRERIRGSGGGVSGGGGATGLGGRGALLAELAREVRALREELDETRTAEAEEALCGGAGKKGNEPSRASLASLRGHHPKATRAQTLPPQRESVSSGSTTNHANQSISDGPPEGVNGGSVTSNQDSGTIYNSQQFFPGNRGMLPHSMSQQHTTTGSAFTAHVTGASSHPKLRFVSSVEFRYQSGETSRTPLSPLCGDTRPHAEARDKLRHLRSEPSLEVVEGDGEGGEERPRLQRSKAQSRNTFRLRRSRRSRAEVSHIRLESDGGSSPCEDLPSAPQSAPPMLRPLHSPAVPLPLTIPPETEWDSESQISQTSSTSGYRESYSLQARVPPPLASPELHDASSSSGATLSHHRSPNGSFSFNGSSSGERTALLGDRPPSRMSPPSMRDEDTLI